MTRSIKTTAKIELTLIRCSHLVTEKTWEVLAIDEHKPIITLPDMGLLHQIPGRFSKKGSKNELSKSKHLASSVQVKIWSYKVAVDKVKSMSMMWVLVTFILLNSYKSITEALDLSQYSRDTITVELLRFLIFGWSRWALLSK